MPVALRPLLLHDVLLLLLTLSLTVQPVAFRHRSRSHLPLSAYFLCLALHRLILNVLSCYLPVVPVFGQRLPTALV